MLERTFKVPTNHRGKISKTLGTQECVTDAGDSRVYVATAI